jgi:purine-cytosine permease-like protein
LPVLFPLVAIFSVLGSVMASLITYNEYCRHFKEKRKAVRAALRAGIVTFLFLFGLSLAAGLFLEKALEAK